MGRVCPSKFNFDHYFTEECLRIRKACDAGNVEGLPEMFNEYRQSGQKVGRMFSQQLGDAILRGNQELITCLRSEGVPLTGSFVREAASSGSVEAFKIILDLGWDINEPCDRAQGPALSYAVRHPDLVAWLLERGADPNARSELDNSALSMAAYFGSLETFDALMKHGGDPKKGELVYNAVRRKDDLVEDMLIKLAQVGAPLNDLLYESIDFKDMTTTERNMCMLPIGTPLHQAVIDGNVRAVKTLMELGAYSRGTRRDGKLPAECAKGNREILDLLGHQRGAL